MCGVLACGQALIGQALSCPDNMGSVSKVSTSCGELREMQEEHLRKPFIGACAENKSVS